MRKIYFLLLTVFSFLSIQNLFAQTTVTIPAANTNSGGSRAPMGTYWGFERYAMIYTAGELAGLGGQVQSVAFFVNGVTSPGAVTNLRIYMKTRSTTFTAGNTYASEIADATLVYGPTTLPASSFVAGQWTTITLATPFAYTGTGNLEIICETNATGTGNEASTAKQLRYSVQPNNQLFQYWSADNSAPSGTGALDLIRPNLQMVMTIPPCVPGSLSGGTVASSVGSSCAGTAFNLSITGASIGTGLTYEWESSPDNATWTTIGGATSAGLTTTQAATTWYRRKTTCSGTDAYSTAVQVIASPALAATFTEDFAGYATAFPPACWSRSNTTYVAGQSTSAYGVGAGSMRFDFYNTGSTLELATAVFGPVPANFRLTFDHAYATYLFGENDRLQILYSTDGGATYTSLITYNGGNTGPLNTGGAQAGSFIPTAAQWASKGIALPAGTNKLLFRGLSAFGNNLYLDNIKVAVTPPCLAPENITFSAITTTTAVINWNASVTPPASGYKWEVRTSGAGGSGATGLAASGTTAAGVLTATASGLSPNTRYSVYVSSDCGSSVVSDWSLATNFTTLCVPAAVPYVQNFDDAVSPNYPECISLQDLNGGGAWRMWYDGDVVTTSEPNAIRYEYDANTAADDWFFLRGLNLVAGKTYTLNFKYKASDGPDYLENLEVKYGAAPNAASMTSTAIFRELNIATNVDDPFAQASVSFTPSASGVFYIGFHAFSDPDQAFLYIDDISVESCPTPTAVTALSPTPTTAIVSFTSTGSNFIVEYGPAGFIPGTGATAGSGTVVTATASPVTLTGLTANTLYDIYVRQNCGGAEFSLNAKVTLQTLCVATNVPYLQDFTGVAIPALPSCTSLQDLNGNPTWQTVTPAPAWGFPGQALRYFYDASKPANDWFFIQGLNLTAGTTYELAFKYGSTDPLYPEKLKVAYGTEAIASAMTTTLVDYPNIVANAAAPFAKLSRVSFTPATTGVYYIGFQAYSDADNFTLYLDSIKVKVQPVVDAGIVDLANAPTCPANNYVLKANLHNYNLVPLDFAVNPVTVTATITGNATQTLTTVVNTGTLAAGANLAVDLPAFSFTPGVYNITTTTVSPDDTETGNDANSILLVVNPSPIAAVFTPTAPQVCAGGTVQVGTQFTTAPPAPSTLTISSGDIDLAIPDNSPVGITSILSTQAIPADATITGISVTLNAEHTWNSDLVFNLKAPNGKVLNLVNSKGFFGAGFVDAIISSTGTTALPTSPVTITGTFAADGALGVGPTGFASNVGNFAGLYNVGNGAWTLAVRDGASGDVGVLNNWSITFTYGKPHPAVTWTPVTGLFTDAAATTAYTANSNAFSLYAKPAGTTTYTATSTSQFGCTSTSTVTVTVNPLPVINIAALPAKICISDTLVPLNATPVGGTWTGIGTSGNNLVPPATAVGTYTLAYSYTDNLGCSSRATTTAKVESCPERIRLLRDDAVLLFPNPNNGQFNIRVNSTLYNKLTMTVYTNSGLVARVQQFTGLAYGRVIPVDLTSMPSGSYMVQFYYDGGVRTSEKTFKVLVGR